MAMSNSVLSIIVPLYNSELDIGKCIESIQRQNYPNYELIIIDDGSSDGSLTIARNYASEDSRIKIFHQENRGVSAARNKGLDVAIGSFITFVDSDDSLAGDTYNLNMQLFQKNPEIDMIQFPTDWGGKSVGNDYWLKSRTIQGRLDILRNWWEGNILNASLWNKLFRKKVFERVRFPEGHIFEDLYVIPDLLEYLDCVYISEFGKYIYNPHADSLSSDSVNYGYLKHFDLFSAHFRIYKKLFEYQSLRQFRVRSFERVYHRLLAAGTRGSYRKIKKSIRQLSEYVPKKKDFYLSKENRRKLFIMKLLGIRLFSRVFLFYLKMKQ